jgi:aconitase A
MSNVDMISLNEGISGLGESSLTGFMNTNAPVRDQSQDPTDPTQISSDQAKKAYQATPGNFSIDVKNKNMYEIDPEAALATANAGIRGVTGMIDRFKNKDREAKMYDNLTADNLYASDPSRDAGDYDVNSGLYRPNEQGATHTSRSAQYGGMMYQDGGYYDEEEDDDDVAYMTEDQIKQFLANGGEIEYL